VTPLLRRASARHFLRHPWQLGLAVAGIALGVAVVVGVDLATASARTAFTLSTRAVAGRATHHVTGGPAGIPDSVFRLLRVDHGIDSIAPVVEGFVRVTSRGDVTNAAASAGDARTSAAPRAFRLLGLDPFSESPFREYLDAADAEVEIGTLMKTEGAVLLAEDAATALGLGTGDTFTVRAGGVPREAVLAGVLRPADEMSRSALSDLIIADIAVAQALLGRTGMIDRIDVLAREDSAAGLDRIRAALPAGLELTSAQARAASTLAMTRAFDINLAALALLALVFGLFLVYNSVTFSVVQRRELIGLLRAQGVTRREIFRIVIAEGLALGAVATALGAALGIVLGRGLVRLVARTINDLYFTLSVTGVTVTPGTIVKAMALGIGATVLASIPGAREATATPPRAALMRSALEARARARTGHAAAVGGAMLVLGCASFLVPTTSLVASLGAVFVVMLGGALLAPGATLLLVRLLRPAASRVSGHVGRMAARGVAATLSRTGPAIAALAVAIAAGTAVGTMIASFRQTVVDWLGTTLQADVYVSAPGSSASRSDTPLDPALAQRVRAVPGVAGVSTYRNVTLQLAEGPVRLAAVDLHPAHRAAFRFLRGADAGLWQSFASEDVVLASEAFAYRRGLHAGDTVVLPGAQGPSAFRIAGVFYDYATEHGVLFMSRRTYDRHWRDPAVSSLGVFVDPGADPDRIIDVLRTLDTGGQEVFFRPQRALREGTLEVFDRTFAITAVLRVLALAVAFAGVLAALMALELEREREIGVLRATGLTAGQVWGLVAAQSGLIGLCAGLLALPLGALLSWIMVDVVNRRSFGWSIRLDLDAGLMAEGLALAVLAALLAGLYPAWRMGSTPPALALREE
jgi:putative ABC transport system permease protein